MGNPTALFRYLWPVLISAAVVVYPFFRVVIPRWPWLAPLGYLWMISLFVGLCGIALWALYQLVKESRRQRSWYTVGVLLLWFVVIIGLTIPPELSHDEGISQVGCFLAQFRGSPAGVFKSTCIWLYPTVSFAVQALPSLLFGVSLSAILIGSSLLLFPGLTLFAYGLRRIVRDVPEGDVLAATALALLSQVTTFAQLLMYHDQTTAPTALTLSFIGLLILVLKDRRSAALFVLLPLLVFSTDMYLPVLSPLAATCAVLAWTIMRPGTPLSWRLPTIATGITILGSLFHYWHRRGDLRISMKQHLSTDASIKAERLINFLFFQREGVPYAAPVLWCIFILFIVLALCGRWGWKGAACAMWMIGTIVCAFYMGGVSPDLAWLRMGGMHRAVPIFPVLIAVTLVGVGPWFTRITLRRVSRAVLILAAIIPAALVLRHFRLPYFVPMGYVMHRTLSERLPPEDVANLFFMVRADHKMLQLLPGHYKVFNPQAKSAEFTKRCIPETLPPPKTLVWTTDEPGCEEEALRSGYEVLSKEYARYGRFLLLRVKPH